MGKQRSHSMSENVGAQRPAEMLQVWTPCFGGATNQDSRNLRSNRVAKSALMEVQKECSKGLRKHVDLCSVLHAHTFVKGAHSSFLSPSFVS